MEGLKDLINISGAIEERLKQAGVNTPEQLQKLGSREAFTRIRLVDDTACFNMLCALEGAVRGIRWFYLEDSTKQELKTFYRSL